MSDQAATPYTVGLTGGIGSGKSTVAKMFAELGVPVLDLDRLGHAVVDRDPDVRARLVEAFGTQILDDNGGINRRKLAGLAFASDAGTTRLNGIVHPAIWAAEREWLSQRRACYVIIEASVLIESGGAGRMDRVIVVLADEAVRRERVLKRGGISEEMFDAIIARQCDDSARLARADHVIENEGDMAQLHHRIELLHAGLSADFGS